MCVLVKIFEGIRWILDQKRALQMQIYIYSDLDFQFIFKTFITVRTLLEMLTFHFRYRSR